MGDKRVKILAQLTLLLIAVAGVVIYFLIRIDSSEPKEILNESNFIVAADGRSLVDESNGFSIPVPDQWKIEDDERGAPGVWMMVPERADVICEIEIGHGKNVTGTSATGFLSIFDIGTRNITNVRDNFARLEDVQGFEAAYLGWTEDAASVRRREVYVPYQGFVLSMRFAEDISPDRFSRQPKPCVRTFDDIVENGLQFP